MTTWPNWVDLIVIILVLRMGYNGFVRGFLAELLSLAGAIGVTALTIQYWGVVAKWVSPWVAFNPILSTLVVFWLMFLALVLGIRVLLKSITELMKWERVHWITQGLGLALGAVRGAWWAGFILLALSLSGFQYLQQSVEQRSVLGPLVLGRFQECLGRVTDRLPHRGVREDVLIPPIKPTPHSKR